MTKEEIQKRIVLAVKKTWKWHQKNQREFRKNNIYLGRMFSMGNIFQYYLAESLFNKTTCEILVDCAIMIKNRRQPLYPDIIIIQNKILQCIIEVKIDGGWINNEDHGIIKVKSKDKKNIFKYNSDRNKFKKEYNKLFKSNSFNYKKVDSLDNKKKNMGPIEIPKKIDKLVVMLMEKINSHNNIPGYKKAVSDAGFQFLTVLPTKDIRTEKQFSQLEYEIVNNKNLINKFYTFFNKIR